MDILSGPSEKGNQFYAGIPCFDSGLRYPLWCPGCLDEAESRDIALAFHTACNNFQVAPDNGAAHAACDCVSFSDRELSEMAFINALDDFDGEVWW